MPQYGGRQYLEFVWITSLIDRGTCFRYILRHTTGPKDAKDEHYGQMVERTHFSHPREEDYHHGVVESMSPYNLE